MDETLFRPTPLNDPLDLSRQAALFYAYIDMALECETAGQPEDADFLYRGANEAMGEILSHTDRIRITPLLPL